MPVSDIQSDFLSMDNFHLAWERVLRSQHAETKDRIALRVFASGIDHNLEQLLQEIEADTYAPSPASKCIFQRLRELSGLFLCLLFETESCTRL